MSTLIRIAGALAALAALAGCTAAADRPGAAAARSAPPACGADWRAEGLAAALDGRGPADGLSAVAGCTPPGPAREAAEDAYLSGHDEGRARYCTPESGAALGRRGETPTLACPPHLQAAFADAMAGARAERGGGAAGSYGGPWVRPNLGVTVGVGDGGVRVGGGLGVGVTF